MASWGAAVADGVAEGLEGFELDGLDAVLAGGRGVLLLGVGIDLDDLVEVGGGEHLAEGGLGGRVAAPAEGDGGVVADEAVLVRADALAEDPVGLGAAEEAQGVDGHLADLGFASAAVSPRALTARGSSSLPSSRAACLARLAAAAIRIDCVELRLQGARQRIERVDDLAALRLGLERLERAQRQGHVLRQLRVF